MNCLSLFRLKWKLENLFLKSKNKHFFRGGKLSPENWWVSENFELILLSLSKDFLRKVFCPVIRETFPNSNPILVPAWYHMSRKYFIHRPEHLLYMRLKWSAMRNGKWWSVVAKCWKKLPLLMIQAARWKKKRYIWQNETLCLEFSYNLKFARDCFHC